MTVARGTEMYPSLWLRTLQSLGDPMLNLSVARVLGS